MDRVAALRNVVHPDGLVWVFPMDFAWFSGHYHSRFMA